MGSLDPYPDPDSQSGYGSRRAKLIHRHKKKGYKFHFLKCWMFSFKAEGFFCSVDIVNLNFLLKKNKKITVFFSSVFCHQNPGSGSDSLEMLDPYPDQYGIQ
jgi:hypothetical protein